MTMAQRVFITGASSGIGAALAREYAARGAVLGLLGRRRAALEALAATLPGRHHLYDADVRDHAGVADAARDFVARAGGVDVVIASSGVSVGTLTADPEDLAVFDDVFATNVMGVVATFAPFIEPMHATMRAEKRAGGGRCRLVAIGSVAGVRGLKGAGAYCASKAAVASYCESLRLELKASGIRVVTIAPGYVDTPMTRVNRFPMPFLMPADRFARAALRAIDAGTGYRIIPWPMAFAAGLLRLLPNALYDLLFAHAPQKSSRTAWKDAA